MGMKIDRKSLNVGLPLKCWAARTYLPKIRVTPAGINASVLGLSKIQFSFPKSDLFNLPQVLNNYTKALRCCSHSAAWEKDISKIKLVVDICLRLIEGKILVFLPLFVGIIKATEAAERFIISGMYLYF